MKNIFWTIILFLLIFLIGLALGATIGDERTNSEFQKQAIEKGFAHYNLTNGVWQWKDKAE